MPVRDIRTRLSLDGEREFNQALQALEREARILTSEMGKLEAQYGLTGDAQEYMDEKGDLLTRQIEQQEVKVRALEQAVADAAEKYGDSAKQTDGYRIKLNNAEKSLINMRKAQQENERAMQDYEKATQDFGDAIEDSANKTDNAAKGMQDAFDVFSAAASGDIEGIINTITDLSQQMTGTTESMGQDALGINASMAGVTAAAATVVATIAKIGAEMYEQKRIVVREAAAMEFALGITEEEAEALVEVGKRLYTEGYADSLDQATQDVKTMKSYMRDLDDTSLTQVTQQAETLAAVTDANVESIARAAAAMREDFGVAATEAMDLFVAAAQKNPIRAGELLEAIQEYSVQFEQMGFTAQEMVNLYAVGLKNNVASIDKLGDAFKELNIRAKDNSESTREALESLGMNADLAMRRIAGGGDAARDTIQQILERLDAMPNALRQNEIGVALMGSQWEDVGAKAILASLDMEQSITDAMGQAAEATRKFNEDVMTVPEEVGRVYEAEYGKIAGTIAESAAHILPLFGELNAELIRDGGIYGRLIGDETIAGVIEGMKEKAQQLYRESENIFQKMFQGIKDMLGIQSPSKAYEQLGKYSGEGYVSGLEKQLADAERNLSMILTPAFDAKTSVSRSVSSVYNDYSQITMKVDDIETFVAIKNKLENERVSKRMGYVGEVKAWRQRR